MDRASSHRHGMTLRFQRNCSKRLLVLGEILAKHTQKCLGLLRTQVNTVAILYRDLIWRLLMNDAEIQKEIPNAYAHLNAVGIGFAIIRRFTDLDPGLGRAAIHCAYRVSQNPGGGLVRKGGFEPP